MADINLDDLLAAKKKETASTDLDLVPSEEIERVTRQVEQLSPEERKKVDAIKDNLDLTDSGSALQFGAAAQKDVAEFSDSILSRVRGKDSGEVGALLGELLTRIKGFEPEEEKSFLDKIPFLGKAKDKVENAMTQYQTLSTQIDRIEASLDKSRADMMKDIATFDGLYEKNLEYFKSLQLYIVAGEEKLTELQQTTLPKLRRQAAESSDPMAAQVVNDFETSVSRFEKKLHDLKTSKIIAIHTAPQIRLIQNSDKDLVDRIQSAIYNTIPLWKNQIVIALGLARQQKVIVCPNGVFLSGDVHVWGVDGHAALRIDGTVVVLVVSDGQTLTLLSDGEVFVSIYHVLVARQIDGTTPEPDVVRFDSFLSLERLDGEVGVAIERVDVDGGSVCVGHSQCVVAFLLDAQIIITCDFGQGEVGVHVQNGECGDF